MDRTVEDVDHVEAHFSLIIEEDGQPHVDTTLTTFYKDGETKPETGVLRGVAAAEVAMACLIASEALAMAASPGAVFDRVQP